MLICLSQYSHLGRALVPLNRYAPLPPLSSVSQGLVPYSSLAAVGFKVQGLSSAQEHVNSQHVTNWDDFGPGLGCHWSMLIRYLSTCDDCWAQERSETKNAWCSRNYSTCIFTSWKLTPWMMDTTAPVTFMLWYVSSQNLLSKTWWENGQMISIPMGKSVQLAAGPWQHAWREGPS